MSFQEGSLVRKGDLLYEIDRQPLEAILAQAKADQATAEARLAKANNDVARYTPLVAKQAVSQRELDDAVAEQDAARSQVDAARASRRQGDARSRLHPHHRAHQRAHRHHPGQGRQPRRPRREHAADDDLPDRSRCSSASASPRPTTCDWHVAPSTAAATGGPQTGIQLTLADGTVYPHTGKVNVVDRAVDPTTGTLGVQLLFPNPDQLLRPGQYGRARALLDTKVGALLVPQRAVQELQNLYSVAVVDAAARWPSAPSRSGRAWTRCG